MQGCADIPLNPDGEAQARNSVAVLSQLSVDVLVTSPLMRAHKTAVIINERLQKPLIVDARIQERNFGIFEGMSLAEMDAWRKEAMLDKSRAIEENGYPLPDKAEPYEIFKQRAVASIREHLDNNAGKNVMFIAHGGVYRVLHRLLFGESHHSPNAQPFLFEKDGSRWALRSFSRD